MPLSAEEREMLDLQTELLRQSQDAMQSGNALNELLMPIVLEEAGYTVEYGDKQVRNPAYDKQVTRLRRWEDAIASGKLGFSDRIEANRKVEEIKGQLKGMEKTMTERGIVGLTQKDDPSKDLRAENERLLLERQGAALRGELPVNPGLLSDLDQQEEDLRAHLLENLGTGFETSTPGIEALAEFGERRNAILDASRRDDIAGAGNLANQMGGFMDSIAASRTGRGMGAAGIPGMNSSNLMQLAQGYGSPMQFMQNNRMMDFQQQQANNSPGLLESLFAQGSGTAMTFGLGKLFDVM